MMVVAIVIVCVIRLASQQIVCQQERFLHELNFPVFAISQSAVVKAKGSCARQSSPWTLCTGLCSVWWDFVAPTVQTNVGFFQIQTWEEENHVQPINARNSAWTSAISLHESRSVSSGFLFVFSSALHQDVCQLWWLLIFRNSGSRWRWQKAANGFLYLGVHDECLFRTQTVHTYDTPYEPRTYDLPPPPDYAEYDDAHRHNSGVYSTINEQEIGRRNMLLGCGFSLNVLAFESRIRRTTPPPPMKPEQIRWSRTLQISQGL